MVDVESFKAWSSNLDSLFYYETEVNERTGEHEGFYEGV